MSTKRTRILGQKLLAMVLVILFAFGFMAEIPLAQGAEKISNPDRRGGIDGIDPNPNVGRHNSYAWAGELFRQTDGDYLWVGMNRDLVVTLGGIITIPQGEFSSLFPALNLPFPSSDRAGRIYRQRASDPNAPWELMHADPSVSGFRRMIIFNDDLYVIGGLTNRPIANYSHILRFPKDFRPGDRPEVVIWEELPESRSEHFRAAAVADDKLYVGTFNSIIYVTDGSGLQNLTPNSGDNKAGWEVAVDLREHGIPNDEIIWDLLAFNGSIYVFTSSRFTNRQIPIRGFGVVKITPGPDGYTVEHIVGGEQGKYPFGMGIPGNVAASGFLSTSFDQEYVYVSTFANGPVMLADFSDGKLNNVFRNRFTPAQIYRFDRYDNWEVVVGDRTGDRVAVDGEGVPIPHVGNHRAGFSLAPDDRKNTSFNQYIWWMAEHEGRLYATTWNMANFRDHFAWLAVRQIEGIIEGAAQVLRSHINPTLNTLHNMLARDSHLINFDSLAAAIDAYLLAAENKSNAVDSREIVEGVVNIIADHLPSADFRDAIQGLTDIIMEVIDEVGVGNQELTTREIAAYLVGEYAFNSTFFGDVSKPFGFGLYVSTDGVNFEPVSVNGFGDPFNYGGRVLVPSEHGLHLLTANPYCPATR